MGDQCALRLIRELRQVEQGEQLAFTVHYDESNMRDILAIIVGPPGTPYELGFFEFSIKVPADYPASPPTVKIKTTNNGRTRFGPNLYATGKVCLSILGTWHGERGEQWSPAQGLESVLLSIQSLLAANPYTLEPGFDDPDKHDEVEYMEAYKSKIRHETLRLAVITPLEQAFANSARRERLRLKDPTKPAEDTDSDDELRDPASHGKFDEFYKRRLLWYFEHYQKAIDSGATDGGLGDDARRQGDPFISMPFEGAGNIMSGHWDYPDLKTRLVQLRDRVMAETHQWPVEGKELVKVDAGIAVKLRGQHEQIVAELSAHPQIIDLSLVDENPFLWQLTYAGRTESRLEGGIVKVKIYISPQHPVEQPRVFVDPMIYHIRVSKMGVLIYLPSFDEDIRHHIDGIVETLGEDNPPYNPLMTVRPQATALCWGNEVERRLYRRKVRASLEEV